MKIKQRWAILVDGIYKVVRIKPGGRFYTYVGDGVELTLNSPIEEMADSFKHKKMLIEKTVYKKEK